MTLAPSGRRWLLLATLLACSATAAEGAAPRGRSAAGDSAGSFRILTLRHERATHRFAVWTPPGYDPARRWPCVVFLHGAGECGNDGERPTTIGLGPELRAHPGRWPVIAVFPQKPLETEEWEERESLVLAVLDRARRDFAVDSNRIALTGISQGGHGVWMFGARHPARWSCLVPVCGYGRPRTVATRLGDLPVWAFHGLDDTVVSPLESRQIMTELRGLRSARTGAPPDSLAARLTLYPGVGHNSWEPAFADPELPAWILARTRPEAAKR